MNHWRQWHISLMTEDECIEALMPPPFDFWLYNHFMIIWRIRHWCWFNLWTGEEGVWTFARHGFRAWKQRESLGKEETDENT